MDGFFSRLFAAKDQLTVEGVAVGVDDDTATAARPPPSPAAIADAERDILTVALHEADADITAALAQLDHVEDEWSAKMGEYMQRNAQLRVDAKQAARRATTAETRATAAETRATAVETELAVAKERILTLEQGLLDAALDGDERLDREVEASSPVHSVAEGYGVVSLRPSTVEGSVEISHDPSLMPSPTGATVEIDADTLLDAGRADDEQDAAELLEQELEAEKAIAGVSAPRPRAPPSTAEAALPSPSPPDIANAMPPPKSAGCCVIS